MSDDLNRDKYIKGRGAQINTANPFQTTFSEQSDVWYDEDLSSFQRTKYIDTHPKKIVNAVNSPDLGFEYSLNPYQGCEHGCIYCYARNTHPYWGYSAGIEFEQKILIKKNAPQLLEQKLKSKSWKAKPIMLSGNTDCYQPAEKKYQLTRKILEVLWKYKHPVSIITKNALILRDLNLLSELARLNLIQVAISLTTLNEQLRTKLEPRAASGLKRLKVVEKLSDAGVPVLAMLAPIIPSLNDMEIPKMAEASAKAGARNISHSIVRLNGEVGVIFKDWLIKNYPDRYDRVIHQIEDCHGGQINDSSFSSRMKGKGQIADMIKQQVRLSKQRYFKGYQPLPLDTELYARIKNPQLSLF